MNNPGDTNVAKPIIVILLMTATLAGGYEVIFHQGFEGEQFPLERWNIINFALLNPAYDSSSCVLAYIEGNVDNNV